MHLYKFKQLLSYNMLFLLLTMVPVVEPLPTTPQSHQQPTRGSYHGHGYGCCPRFVLGLKPRGTKLLAQASQSASWHARPHFHCASNSCPYFLLCLFSCSFRRRRLDHSNGIEWEHTLSFFALFRAQIGIGNLFSTRLCFSLLALFLLLIILSR